jgi:hypothetical protein
MYLESNHLEGHGRDISNRCRFEKGLFEYSREEHADGVCLSGGFGLY